MDTKYDEQYAKINEAYIFTGLNGKLDKKIYDEKRQAVHDVILINTIRASQIAIAHKYIDMGNEVEVRYFTKQLALHCYDIFDSGNKGVSFRIISLCRMFRKYMIPPPVLKKMSANRMAMSKLRDAHLSYFESLSDTIRITDKFGSPTQKYKLLIQLDRQQIMERSRAILDNFIPLNDLLVELLKYLNDKDDSEEIK